MKRALVVAVAGLTAACGSSSPPTASTAASLSARGAGCAADAAQVPAGTWAASSKPPLTTLAAAVSGKLNPRVDLVDTLDSGQFTVFAPVDAAFAELPTATVDTFRTDPGLLTKILTYHVLPTQITPDKITGEWKTVEGLTVTVAGTPGNLTVNGTKVLCHGVRTANATVYLVDGVLTPQN
jgi:uncharacterized surface protein with fasciclin (FAS1) repeats